MAFPGVWLGPSSATAWYWREVTRVPQENVSTRAPTYPFPRLSSPEGGVMGFQPMWPGCPPCSAWVLGDLPAHTPLCQLGWTVPFSVFTEGRRSRTSVQGCVWGGGRTLSPAWLSLWSCPLHLLIGVPKLSMCPCLFQCQGWVVLWGEAVASALLPISITRLGRMVASSDLHDGWWDPPSHCPLH